jgi:hypothetical protein
MAQFIDPKCAVPTFLLDNEDDAKHCGRLTGYIIASVIIIIVIIAAIYFYMLQDHSMSRMLIYIVVVSISSLIIWLTIPFISAWLRAVSWRGYNSQKEFYIKGGMNGKDAIQQLQQLEQTYIQADAIRTAGQTIGNSFTKSLLDYGTTYLTDKKQ